MSETHVDYASLFTQYEQVQTTGVDALRQGTYENPSKQHFFAQDLTTVLSPRKVEQVLHQMIPNSPKWGMEDMSGWGLPALTFPHKFTGLTATLKKRLPIPGQLPGWFPTTGFILPHVAQSQLYKVETGLYGTTASNVEVVSLLNSLPKRERMKEHLYQKLKNGGWYNAGAEATALLARDGVFSPWMRNLSGVPRDEFHPSSLLGYVQPSPFYTTVMVASEKTLMKQYEHLPLSQKQGMFALSWARRVPFTAEFLTMLSNDSEPHPEAPAPDYFSAGRSNGGVRATTYDDFREPVSEATAELHAEMSYIQMMLAHAVTIPMDTLAWVFSRFRVSTEKADQLHQVMLLRLFSDGMLDNWVKQEQLDGIPRDMLFDLVANQFPTWDALADLPVNAPARLKGHPNCDCHGRRR